MLIYNKQFMYTLIFVFIQDTSFSAKQRSETSESLKEISEKSKKSE